AHLHIALNVSLNYATVFSIILLGTLLWKRWDRGVLYSAWAILLVGGALGLIAAIAGLLAQREVVGEPGAAPAMIAVHLPRAIIAAALYYFTTFMVWRTYKETAEDVGPLRRRRITFLFGLSLITLIALFWTSVAGSNIRHSEVRGDALSRALNPELGVPGEEGR
ncbi:MAG TPA: hypothetical protein VEI97_20395, partial [bacterium]|nr:hypothetical protein [bacterium]